ncbi:MAG: hypothetical protein ABWY00_10630 [Dongiaceae bacterium]
MTSPYKILSAAGIMMLAATGGVLASSTEAWNDLADKVNTACIDASELKAAKVIWSNPYFETQVAAVVDGKMPQKQMKGARATILCLYDKKTGRTEIQDFDSQLLK